MKLKQLINGGALAATVLTLGSAQADYYDGVVFCKAQAVSTGDSSESVSITLPFNATTSEGQAYTYWNLGTVAAGGVADSWHSEGGPGKFVAHNNGGTGVYVYLTSSSEAYERWSGDWVGYYNIDQEIYQADEFVDAIQIWPVPSLRAWKAWENVYCLAFSKDVTAKIPTWHMLDRFTDCGIFAGEWRDSYDEDQVGAHYIGAYMGYLDAGDYMAFDVKFWAPQAPSDWDYAKRGDYRQGVRFTFMVTAAPFPLWEHDREVQ